MAMKFSILGGRTPKTLIILISGVVRHGQKDIWFWNPTQTKGFSVKSVFDTPVALAGIRDTTMKKTFNNG